jgi:hypothetical protein
LPKGQTQVKQAGQNGIEIITYQVTYTNGKETSRKQTADAITTQPTPQIVSVGTYVAPAPSYTNSNGNTVPSPSYSTDGNVPAGATAQCNDGTYSFSQHRSGTCSHHGGVAVWY